MDSAIGHPRFDDLARSFRPWAKFLPAPDLRPIFNRAVLRMEVINSLLEFGVLGIVALRCNKGLPYNVAWEVPFAGGWLFPHFGWECEATGALLVRMAPSVPSPADIK